MSSGIRRIRKQITRSSRRTFVLIAVLGALAAAMGGYSLAAPSTPPTISISDVPQSEGNSGNKDFVFTVALSDVSDKSVKVDYQTANGTATAGSDYNAAQGS